ncbi:MAG TPA: EutN/CcmL family microcompartment protein [Phycisphaerae bacterium]|nr:EutN/CcmL family microcompartment protein [Phycisphaerae bacterium]
MRLGLVEGNITASIRHKSMAGWKVLIVQPLDRDGRADGDPVLAIDMLGAGHGTRVVISNDGKGTREMIGDTTSPVRWSVIGLVDE